MVTKTTYELLEEEFGEEQQYPSRKPNDENFTYYWEKFIQDVTARENFKENHLEQLVVLCDLYVEYETLYLAIQSEGYTVVNGEGGRNGKQNKPHPAVAMLNTCRTEIRNYSKMLGLLLVKDTNMNTEKTEENWK